MEENELNAIAFYRVAYKGNSTKAVRFYVGDEYMKHNPLVALHTNQIWKGEGEYITIDFFGLIKMAKL